MLNRFLELCLSPNTDTHSLNFQSQRLYSHKIIRITGIGHVLVSMFKLSCEYIYSLIIDFQIGENWFWRFNLPCSNIEKSYMKIILSWEFTNPNLVGYKEKPSLLVSNVAKEWNTHINREVKNQQSYQEETTGTHLQRMQLEMFFSGETCWAHV